MSVETIVRQVLDSAFLIHRELGPGLLESVYESILARQLVLRGLEVERQKQVSFTYRGAHYQSALTLDMLVEGQLVVELKSVEKIAPVHLKQVLTYLRALNLPLGLLINFGASRLSEGLKRVVNGYKPARADVPRANKTGRSS